MKFFDERRDVAIFNNAEEAIKFSADHFLHLAKKSIEQNGVFKAALSGGSTPKAIYQELSQKKDAIDWSKILLFFSDERSVSIEDNENNYRMAMEAGLNKLPIPHKNIFRMKAEFDIEQNAIEYEKLIEEHVKQFDLVMLGMGEDGHTASLFPETHGLKSHGRLAIANYVPQKKTWRMSLSFDCINSSKNIAIYVLGLSKAKMVAAVLEGPYEPDLYPIQQVGTTAHKALWILDKAAASLIEI